MKINSRSGLVVIALQVYLVNMSFFLSQVNAQPTNFFPLDVGNTWQYIDVFTGSVDYTESIIGDSSDSVSNSNFYWFKQVKPTHTVFNGYELDTALQVWHSYDAPPSFTRHELLYKLSADIGDWWGVEPADTAETFRALVVDQYQGVVFSDSTQIKQVDYWLQSETDSFFIETRYIAAGFGLVERFGEFIWHRARGAIIDSVLHGFIVDIDNPDRKPNAFLLYQNYPNPFNPSTRITFYLPNDGGVKLEVFNTLGQRVQTLTDGYRSAGDHVVLFDGSSLPSGVYIYRLTVGNQSKAGKMVLVK